MNFQKLIELREDFNLKQKDIAKPLLSRLIYYEKMVVKLFL